MRPRSGGGRAKALAFALALLLALPGRAAKATGEETAGVLLVRSQPGVEVLWEGVALGRTDASGALEVRGIPPGTYGVELRRNGFRGFSTQLEIAAGANRLDHPLGRERAERTDTPAPAPAVGTLATRVFPSEQGVGALPPPRSRLSEPPPRRPAAAARAPAAPAPGPLAATLLGLTSLGVLLATWRALAGRRAGGAKSGSPRRLEARRSSPAAESPAFLGALRRREATLEGSRVVRRGVAGADDPELAMGGRPPEPPDLHRREDPE